ncbi:MAG: ABC transporter permease [Lachnospiraceae bacterium]|jgi:ribose transport system permease protein|nr:ABC transporter permease [Lachnospiraceae bacterium]MBQ8328387.1 ABC transporter permease [Lachnospiraceae bacterium]
MNQTTMRRLISIGMLIILVVLFTILAGAGKGKFFNFDNLIEVVRDASIPAIIGVGVTFIIITAGIDLSTGSMMALVGMTMANIYAYTLLPFSVMILAGILVGLLCGLCNGVIVAKFNVPEFIGTLATMSIFRALTYIIAIRDANGVIKSQPMNHSQYTWLGGGFGKFYFVIIAMIIIVAAGQIVLKYTRYGTNLYSVGASKKAATLSGIDVAKTRLIAYVITGFTVAVGAVFTTARLQSATTAIGMDFEFNPIAAAVVGGVALSGGSGDVIGTLIGALFMATLENGVRKLSINTAYQYVIKGAIIIAVVIFDATYKARMDRKAREEGAKEGLE